ncbi:hypothetical protein Tco_0127741 [Tanacetum coccineum]
MHGQGHPKLAKKLNDKIPKMVDEMSDRVRAFIRGEKTTGVYTPYPRRDTFTLLTKTLKEILAMEGISFPEPPPLIGIPKKKNLNKFCDYHGDRGYNTNDCYQLKKQIEEAVASDNNRKRPYEEERSGMTEEHTFQEIPQNNPTDELIVLEGMMEGFSGETYHPLGLIDQWVTMGEAGRNKIVLMEFAIVKCHSPYNVLMGRTGMRSLGAVVSTIYSMINFPTELGVVTMETSRETMWECMELEKCWARGKKHNGVSTWNECQEYMNKHYCEQGTALDRDLVKNRRSWKKGRERKHNRKNSDRQHVVSQM